MSEVPPNCSIASCSKIISIPEVDEKNKETKFGFKRLPKVELNFFYLVHLLTDVKFSKELANRKSLRFNSFALSIESEYREIFKNLKECKIVEIKSKYFGRKSIAIMTMLSHVQLKSEEQIEKLRKMSEDPECGIFIKIEFLKFKQLDKEMYEHYNKHGKRLCISCGEFKF